MTPTDRKIVPTVTSDRTTAFQSDTQAKPEPVKAWKPVKAHKPGIEAVLVCRADSKTGKPTAVVTATHIDFDTWLFFGPMGPQGYKDPTHWLSLDSLPTIPVRIVPEEG